MYRIALGALAATVLFAATVVSAEPKLAEVSAENLARARGLVRQLGSDIFQDRENAAAELLKLGRSALPAIAEGAKTSDDIETRKRCEFLISAIEADELNAKIEAFVADKEGKLEHDLPGWKEMRSATDGGPLARSLFAEMVKNPEILYVLAGLNQNPEVFSRRAIDWNSRLAEMMHPKVVGKAKPLGYKPSAAEHASILLFDCLLGDKASKTTETGRDTVSTFISHYTMRTILQSDKHGAVVKQILLGWCDTLTGTKGVRAAMFSLTTVNLQEAARYAEKYLEMPDAETWSKAQALSMIGRFGRKEKISVLEKLFNDKTEIKIANPGEEQMQLRDVALSMSVLAAGKAPADFGYTTLPGFVDAKEDSDIFTFWVYRFPSDEVRMKAFEKWKAESMPQK